jgi:hypothetical protein
MILMVMARIKFSLPDNAVSRFGSPHYLSPIFALALKTSF